MSDGAFQVILRFDDETSRSMNIVAVTPLEIRTELHLDPYLVDTLVIDRRKAETRPIKTSGLNGGFLATEALWTAHSHRSRRRSPVIRCPQGCREAV